MYMKNQEYFELNLVKIAPLFIFLEISLLNSKNNIFIENYCIFYVIIVAYFIKKYTLITAL